MGNENGVKLNSVGAYYVYTHSQQARKESKESLFSLIGEDGLINESALDDASEVIMDKFDKLMDIYRKRPKDTKTA